MIISYENLNLYIYVNSQNKVWGVELNDNCYADMKRKPIEYTGVNIKYKKCFAFKVFCYIIDILLTFY